MLPREGDKAVTTGEMFTIAGTATISALVGHFWKRLLRIGRPLGTNGNGTKSLKDLIQEMHERQIRHEIRLTDLSDRMATNEEILTSLRGSLKRGSLGVGGQSTVQVTP